MLKIKSTKESDIYGCIYEFIYIYIGRYNLYFRNCLFYIILIVVIIIINKLQDIFAKFIRSSSLKCDKRESQSEATFQTYCSKSGSVHSDIVTRNFKRQDIRFVQLLEMSWAAN